MGDGSNTAERIAELRRRIQANKGIAKRAWFTSNELRAKARRAEEQVRWDQNEIEAMGGKVRR